MDNQSVQQHKEIRRSRLPIQRYGGPSNVLALNALSSSLKVALMDGDERTVTFLAERLDTKEAILHFKIVNASKLTRLAPNMNHADALHHILQFMIVV
jgi:acetate kinase